MPVDIIGTVRKRDWFQTGVYSVDKAFENPAKGRIGVPMSIMELFGPNGVGKTTLSWFLVSEAAKTMHKNIVMLNIEVFDPEMLQTSFEFYQYDGKIYIADGETDEGMFDDAIKMLRKDDYGAYILDSIGAVSPVAELEGEAGAANMGRRARIVNPHFRLLGHLDRGKPFFAIAINHVHPNLGTVGTTTPGGNTPKYLSANRVRVKRDHTYPDGSFTIEGTVIKNRFGVEKRVFWVFVLGGYGVHKGMSALIDCQKIGLLKKPKGGKTWGWADTGEKVPTDGALVKAAKAGETEVFEQFHQALQRSGVVVESSDEEISDDE